MGLPCMNCGKDTTQEEAKLFAECLVCPDCYQVAERIYLQGQLELKYLLTTLKELIRVSIVQHQLSLPPPPGRKDGQVPDRKAIDVIVEMMRKSSCPTLPPKSTKKPLKPSMKPFVPTVAGEQSSSSIQGVDSSLETLSTGTLPVEPPGNV